MEQHGTKPKIIVLCGPTAIGKTSTAITLAARFNGQIIGADSMQIYRYMDIGTAKPTAEEQARVRHHMIDIADPDEHFDAAQYAAVARRTIMQLQGKGIVAFVVGGTGLYIKALLHGLFESEPIDPQVRKRLLAAASRHGRDFLHKRLAEIDPETSNRLHPHDTYRILRALEIFEATGQPIIKYHRNHGFSDDPFCALKIGLTTDRVKLYERINQRVDTMIAAGFVAEVKKLIEMGYSGELKSMQAIGYRHMVDFIEGRLPWEECIRTLKRDQRRYAKRQLTWFNSDRQIIWKEPGQLKPIMERISEFLMNS
jgi:tRNA dimethylallyltransferase